MVSDGYEYSDGRPRAGGGGGCGRCGADLRRRAVVGGSGGGARGCQGVGGWVAGDWRAGRAGGGRDYHHRCRGVGGPGPARTVAVSPCAGINSDFDDPLQCDVTGAARTSGNGGPARKAGVFSPSAARVDRHGNLVIAQNGLPGDHGEPNVMARLRVVAAATGRFYGLSMKAGNIYTIPVKTSPVAAFVPGHLALRIDHAGNLVLGNSFFQELGVVAVRTGTFYGKKMTAGHMYRPGGVGRDLCGRGGARSRWQPDPG